MYKSIIQLVITLSFVISTVSAERTDLLINSGWIFQKDAGEGASVEGFDDTGWESVRLPHTWNAADGQDGGSDFWRGPGWYRRTLNIEGWEGKRFFLHFEGALTTTDAFVNGVHVGQHKGGYAAFRFDITDAVRPGQNTLAVKVDNSLNKNIPPLSGDWTFYGGIYRDLHLLVVDPVHVDLMDHGSPGVFITQNIVDQDLAEVEVRTRIVNDRDEKSKVSVKVEVLDHWGSPVSTVNGSKRVDSSSSFDFAKKIRMESPRLWQGQSYPYLYTVRVSVTADDGSHDVVRQPLGLRTFRVSPNRGFFLNGAYIKLHGVNRHQDRLDMGNALTAKEHKEDFDLIREMGVNTIRLAHYQHAEYFYDLCDQDGQIVWAELALVNGVTDTPEFNESAKQQLRELIRQNYNHPSIVMWSIFNEIRINERFAGGGANPHPILSELNDLAKEEDGTRLTTSAAMTDPEDAVAQLTDLQSFNRYHGWYYEKPEDFGPWIDSVHEKFPDSRLGISEYGAGASTSFHAEGPVSQDHTEEWQNIFHETWWQAIEARPYIWGTHVWNMFDFGSDMRDEGDHKGRNDKGLVTFDRKIKKDPYFYYKANWSDSPVVHVTSRRFNPRKIEKIDVKVYSNMDQVELTVSGRPLGSKKSNNHIYVWEDVELALGDNQVIAIGRRDGRTVSDVVTWVREKSELAVLTSSTFAIHETGKFIANTPMGLTVHEMMDEVAISAGSSVQVLESEEPLGGDAQVLDGVHVVVTAEDGEHISNYRVLSGPVSLGRPVEASSFSPGGFGLAPGPPENANDGDLKTPWMGSFRPPYWWAVDLGTSYHLADVRLAWPVTPEKEDPGSFFYTIEVSLDGNTYQEVASSGAGVVVGNTSDPIERLGRFVRVNIDSSTVKQTVNLFNRDIEFAVNGLLEATVIGGLVVSDVVRIDYAAHTISGAGMSNAKLMAKCSGVGGATLVIEGEGDERKVVATSIDKKFKEAYTLR